MTCCAVCGYRKDDGKPPEFFSQNIFSSHHYYHYDNEHKSFFIALKKENLYELLVPPYNQSSIVNNGCFDVCYYCSALLNKFKYICLCDKCKKFYKSRSFDVGYYVYELTIDGIIWSEE